jgi:hypothetical protein
MCFFPLMGRLQKLCSVGVKCEVGLCVCLCVEDYHSKPNLQILHSLVHVPQWCRSAASFCLSWE